MQDAFTDHSEEKHGCDCSSQRFLHVLQSHFGAAEAAIPTLLCISWSILQNRSSNQDTSHLQSSGGVLVVYR